MTWLKLAVLICVMGCTPQNLVDLHIQPIERAMKADRAALEALPDDAPLIDRFGLVYRLDQAPRMAMGDVGKAKLSPEDQAKVHGRLSTLMSENDPGNLAQVLKYLPSEGWYLKSRYGEAVATTAFLVVQHSNQANWQRFLPVFEGLVPQGEVDGAAYAMMYDRLALSEGRPQRYGTQFTCVRGKWITLELEAPETVDERRRFMNMPRTQAEEEAIIASTPCR